MATFETSAATFGLYIAGEWRPTSHTLENRNPANPSDLVALVGDAEPADVADAYTAARDSFESWSQRSPVERASILDQAAGLLEARCEAIAVELTREEGKTLAEARSETLRASRIFKYYAGECMQAIGDVYPSADPQTLLYTQSEPVGVVAVITPWNFPIGIPAWKIAPALAYGNTVVWKPSELTPLCAIRLVETLADAGLPAGVLNLVTGLPQNIGEALTDDLRLDALTFTGSEAVGRSLYTKLAPRGLKVQLELGGKNPVIVMPDAHLEHAVEQTVRGAMMSAGQKCTATSRAIVHATIIKKFTERLLDHVAALRVGDPLSPETDVGPLVSEKQLRGVERYFDIARSENSELGLGGHRIAGRDGCFVTPTVYVDADPQSRLGQDEIFGPVLAVMRANSLSDALQIANSVKYGLSASIFTQNLTQALTFARQASVGIVHVNSETAGAEPHVPFGGMKASSSHSREQGKSARDFFTDTKTIYVTSP